MLLHLLCLYINNFTFFTEAKLTIIINQPMFNTRRIKIKNTVTSPRTCRPN